MRLTSKNVFQGMWAGWAAGGIVALWFLVVDLVAGSPFRTPLELGGIFLADTGAVSPAPLVLGYSLLHFGAFACLGVFAVWLIRGVGVRPGWLLGLALGVGVLNGAHYTSLLASGSDALTVLPWPHVVGANLLAGVALTTVLHRATRDPRPLGWSVLRDHPIVTEGLVVGSLGAAAVALWFLLVDLVAGRPFYTPAALGSALFLGSEGPEAVRLTPGTVAAYTALHLAVFWGVGMLLVAWARQLERAPSLAYLSTLALILLEAVSFGVFTALGEWVVGQLSLWAIGIGNLMALGAMAGRIWRSHPALREGVQRRGFTVVA